MYMYIMYYINYIIILSVIIHCNSPQCNNNTVPIVIQQIYFFSNAHSFSTMWILPWMVCEKIFLQQPVALLPWSLLHSVQLPYFVSTFVHMGLYVKYLMPCKMHPRIRSVEHSIRRILRYQDNLKVMQFIQYINCRIHCFIFVLCRLWHCVRHSSFTW